MGVGGVSDGRDDVVRRENRHGVEKRYVRTCFGTTVVETKARVRNPVTDKEEDLADLSPDGYKRRFLAVLAAYNSPSVVDLDSSPVLTFDRDKWEIEEAEGSIVVTKRDVDVEVGGADGGESA